MPGILCGKVFSHKYMSQVTFAVSAYNLHTSAVRIGNTEY